MTPATVMTKTALSQSGGSGAAGREIFAISLPGITLAWIAIARRTLPCVCKQHRHHDPRKNALLKEVTALRAERGFPHFHSNGCGGGPICQNYKTRQNRKGLQILVQNRNSTCPGWSA